MNCLRSLRAFASCFLELNDVFWELRSTNVFFKVSKYLSDESEFIVASLSPLRGPSFLSQNCTSKKKCRLLQPNISRTFFELQERVSMIDISSFSTV